MDITKEVKKQFIEWEKIFVKCLFDKELISRIHKEFLKPNNKKTTCLKSVQKSESAFFQRRNANDQ